MYLQFNKMVQFESNVILDRYKTINNGTQKGVAFESNVILDRYKTAGCVGYGGDIV